MTRERSWCTPDTMLYNVTALARSENIGMQTWQVTTECSWGSPTAADWSRARSTSLSRPLVGILSLSIVFRFFLYLGFLRALLLDPIYFARKIFQYQLRFFTHTYGRSLIFSHHTCKAKDNFKTIRYLQMHRIQWKINDYRKKLTWKNIIEITFFKKM